MPAAAAEKKGSLFFDSPTGRKIEYRISGRAEPDDPLLLVLHGMVPKGFGPACASLRLTRKGSKSDVAAAIGALPFTIVTPARPGYDRSTGGSKPLRQLTYEDCCEDYLALMDKVCFDLGRGPNRFQFAVSANSSGGLHALTLAYTAPNRVLGLQLNGCDALYAPGYPKAAKMNSTPTTTQKTRKLAPTDSSSEETPPPQDEVLYKDGGIRPGCNFMYLCYGLRIIAQPLK